MFITGKIKFFLKNIDFIRKSNIFPVNFVVVSKKNNLINSIVNTLTELTEINQVKIIIDGNENEELNEIYTRKNNQ